MCQVAREGMSDIASAPYCEGGDKSRGLPHQEHSDKIKSAQRDAQRQGLLFGDDSTAAHTQIPNKPERTVPDNAHLGYISPFFGSQKREESARVLWLDVLRLDARVRMGLELATM